MKTMLITHEKAVKKGDLKLQTSNTQHQYHRINTIQKIAQLNSKVTIMIRFERFLLQKITQ